MPALRCSSPAGPTPHFPIPPEDDGHPHDVLLIRRGSALDMRGRWQWEAKWGKWHMHWLVDVLGIGRVPLHGSRQACVPAAWGRAWDFP